MFKQSYKIATVWGIPIKLHISLILMLLWFSSFAGWFNGIILTVGLLTSIALHELGHSIVAIKKGCRVRQITLMCIGGAAQMERIPSKPKDEFLMATAGPLVSLCLGTACISLGRLLPLPIFASFGDIPLNIVQVIGAINIVLAIFNLLPAFPMDGGRVLRAMLTPKLGRLKATFVAARLGKILSILFGIYSLSDMNLFGVAIAFFIFIAAGKEYRVVQMEEAAKKQGFGYNPWTISGNEPSEYSEYDNSDKVIVSPPPYEKGPDSETDIYSSDDDNPFTKIFG
ncbi:site-2 protease family protein [Verrucomicrobiota bacterium]